jgi:hypothetical protein
MENKDLYVYIVTHPCYPGWIKIGRAFNPKARLSSYNTGCPHRNYEMIYSKKTELVSHIETFFYKNIEGNGHEWFKVNEKIAIEFIENIVTSNILILDNKKHGQLHKYVKHTKQVDADVLPKRNIITKELVFRYKVIDCIENRTYYFKKGELDKIVEATGIPQKTIEYKLSKFKKVKTELWQITSERILKKNLRIKKYEHT